MCELVPATKRCQFSYYTSDQNGDSESRQIIKNWVTKPTKQHLSTSKWWKKDHSCQPVALQIRLTWKFSQNSRIVPRSLKIFRSYKILWVILQSKANHLCSSQIGPCLLKSLYIYQESHQHVESYPFWE